MKARYGVVAPYILYVGNFLPHKNVPTLLRAYAALPGPVRTGHGALPEVVADAGLRVDASRETELAAAMVRVLSDAGFPRPVRGLRTCDSAGRSDGRIQLTQQRFEIAGGQGNPLGAGHYAMHEIEAHGE